MSVSMILPTLTAAVSVGLGCGTCCSPIISSFLSIYVMSHSNGVKKGVLSFFSFFIGKMLSVSSLCMISALISRQFIEESGYVGSFNLRLLSQAAMSIIGMVMVIRWGFERKKQKKCESCRECGRYDGKVGAIPMLMAGFTYGMTPCAPLLMMIGYSFTLSVSMAGIVGIVFSISSMVSPVLLLVVVTGVLSKKMAREIPDAVKWFRLASYVLLMIMPLVLTSGY